MCGFKSLFLKFHSSKAAFVGHFDRFFPKKWNMGCLNPTIITILVPSLQLDNQSSYRGSPIIASLVSQSLSALVENWLMWPWRVKIHAFSPKVTQPLLVLLYRILPNQTSCCASFVNVFMLKFCQEFEAKVWSRFWGRILLKFKKVSKIAHASCSWWFNGEFVLVVSCCYAITWCKRKPS